MKFHSPTPLAVSAAVVLGLAGAAALAAPPPDPVDPMQPSTPAQQRLGQVDSPASIQARFEALDLNHDGYVDKTEASANKALSAQFDKLDTNHDGKLSPAEFSKAKGLTPPPTGSDGNMP